VKPIDWRCVAWRAPNQCMQQFKSATHDAANPPNARQAAWIYGSMLLGCLPSNSLALRRAFLCLAYLICGYVARCAAERTISGGSGAGGGGGAHLAKWPPNGDWLAAFAQHAQHAAAAAAGASG